MSRAWATQETRVGATFHKDRPSYARMGEFALNQSDFVGYHDDNISCFCGD